MKLFGRKKKKVNPVLGSGEWASALAEALGEDPSGSYDIELSCVANDVVRVTIKKFVDVDNQEIIDVIKKVAWEKSDPDYR